MNALRPTRSIFVLGLLATLTLPGCYSTPESFARRASRLACVNLRECQEEMFDAQFHGEMDECRDFYQDVFEETIADAEAAGCEYDPDEGRDCIHEMYEHRKDCSTDQQYSDCGNIFSCPTPLELDEPGLPSALEVLASFPPDASE